jgi:hypothetical protein
MVCDRNTVVLLENHSEVSKYRYHGIQFVQLVMKPAVVQVTFLRISSLMRHILCNGGFNLRRYGHVCKSEQAQTS